MSGYTLRAVAALGNVIQGKPGLLLAPLRNGVVAYESVRGSKHWLPKWKKLRAAKYVKFDLPDYHEELTPEKTRAKMKERGLLPARPWLEKPLYISCTGGINEQYVPPEGDGKFTALSSTGAKQKVEFVGKKAKTMMAIRKIKSFEEEFNVTDFPDRAQEIYIKAHQAVVNKNQYDLRLWVTEKAYPEIRHNSVDKTIRWRFIESLEPPRVVAVTCASVVTKENYFAQVTVRFHTQQSLAIYDRFGRLMSGSEILKKDVLEYVVFEKHLASEYGTWRLHGKILPPWAPPREFGERTFIEAAEEPEDKEKAVSSVATSNVPEVKAQPAT